ncbi:MAG TPA: thioredoxin domain-containing protein [Kineosporiaceae bacterium]|nr:thioredoxin domain-containing protein [Kineosporiaceae bacterium]
MSNRLAAATSPYLLQHKDNPVDWREWGDAAFEEAKRRDVPVLLSVGYAACHWCHVMAHESFEDAETAAEMNAGFVNVKVDREERPDVDAVYMSATQALTGHGGWPMTVFLTPQGRPFYAGTYFPPQPRHQLPSFRQVLSAIGDTWRTRRDEVEDAGSRISEALAERAIPVGSAPPTAPILTEAVRLLAADEDRVHGGFGSAPKFPPSATLEFLLRHSAANPATDDEKTDVARGLADRTLRAMAHSGMYDQLAGGFARYSVDRAWVVPHFEKMLYDNAQLARVYLHWWRLTGEPTGARVALETCDWMLAELGTAEGGLASSLDADTQDEHGHGVEGLTYVWTPAELVTVLGPADGEWAAELLKVTPAGTFEHGSSTLQLARDPWATPEEAERWTTLRGRLALARADRPQPGRDDKVVAAWNGLAIAALAETGALLARPDLITAAERIAGLLLDVHWVGVAEGKATGGAGRLRRVSRDGVVGTPGGVLEDYGDLAEGLLALHSVTGAARWLRAAGDLLDVVLSEFIGSDGVHDTPAGATDAALAAVRRPGDPTDNAYPSGASAAAGALLGYAALTGSSRHRQAAETALAGAGAVAGRAPQAFGWALAVSQALLDGPREVAVVGQDGDPARVLLHATALAATAPGLVVSVGPPEAEGVPLLAGRALIDGAPTAYVCRDFACSLPTTEPDVLAAQLRIAAAPAG